jgi:hypothetical protein
MDVDMWFSGLVRAQKGVNRKFYRRPKGLRK